MNIAPHYYQPVVKPNHHQFHPEQLNPAIETFTAGHHLQAFIQTLNAIKPETVTDEQSTALDLVVPNGSIQLQIKVDQTHFFIIVPFLQVGEKGKVGLLRQVAEINMEALTLAQIELRDQGLYFVYSAPLALSHPQKVYAILHEICFKADYYDDVFIQKLHATPLAPASVTALESAQQAVALQTYHTIITEALAYVDYVEQKRRLDLAMCVLCSALMAVDRCLQPQGFLRSELEKAINAMFERGPQLNELVQRTKASIKKLLDLSPETVQQSFYIPEFFIPIKTLLDAAATRSKLQAIQEQYKKAIADTDYLEVTLGVTWQLYRLLYYYDLPATAYQSITQTLTKAAQQPWQEAAAILMQCVNDLSKD